MNKSNYTKIVLPMLAIGLSAAVLAACSQKTDVHAQSQAITSPQEVLAAGAGRTSVPVDKSAAGPDSAVPAKGEAQPIALTNAPDGSASDMSLSGNTAGITLPEGSIPDTEAKRIALEHARVAEADVTFLKIKLDYDDGIIEYEVEFYVGNQEYDYDIDAATGTIRSFDYDIEDDYPDRNNSISGNTATPISEADAKNIALAKVPGATAANIKGFEADWDDGILKYEGEIKYGGMEYEFEIDAATGSILEWDVDEDD